MLERATETAYRSFFFYVLGTYKKQQQQQQQQNRNIYITPFVLQLLFHSHEIPILTVWKDICEFNSLRSHTPPVAHDKR